MNEETLNKIEKVKKQIEKILEENGLVMTVSPSIDFTEIETKLNGQVIKKTNLI